MDLVNPGGLGCALFERMHKFQNEVAQIDGITGETENYQSFLQRCVRTALVMRDKGVTPDHFINICGTPSMDVSVPFIATLFLGATPTTLDPNSSFLELSLLLKQVKPRMTFVDQDAVEKMEKAVAEIEDVELVVFGEHPNHMSFKDFLKPHPEEKAFKCTPAKDLKDTAIILYSSGTSGLPKGICLHHQGFFVMAQRMAFSVKKLLVFSALNWISAVAIIISAAFHGNSRIIVPRFIPEKFWELMDITQPGVLFLSPVQIAVVLRFPRPPPPEPYLKLVLISGAPIAKAQIISFRALVPEAIALFLYGLTELFATATCFNPRDPKHLVWMTEKPTSCGVATPGISLKVVDLETEKELGPNQKGELRIKTNTQMNGYYNLDSSEVWDKDGWMKTGDVAYYDEDHCLFVVDRIKETFKFRSHHIAPVFLEGILLQHPAVEDATVVGIPHKEDGDHPMALVVISKNCKNVTAEEIKKFVEERVSDVQKLRAGVKLVDSILRTSTGKIKRTEIQDKVLKGEI